MRMTSLRNPHQVTTVKCAAPGCANVRREANHWFVISVVQGRFTCRHYSPAFTLRPIDEPACGQACAQKLLERYLAQQTGDNSRQPKPNVFDRKGGDQNVPRA